jgi:aminoglycoside N3'-acetyltransferase
LLRRETPFVTTNNLLRGIKSRVAGALSSEAKLRIKKLVRKTRNALSMSRKLELPEMESILVHRLGISAGDAILVHSSFGSLNADFSPRDLINLLKTIVTPAGLIVMPYYPPDSAVAWLERKEVFDHNSTNSSMGVLTTMFKNDPEVFVSIHPIKALAAWGTGAEQFVSGHPHAVTPFDKESPYAKLGKMERAKSIGIGIERCTFFHHCEDVLLVQDISSRYLPTPLAGLVRDKNGQTVEVTTLVHDPIVMGARELSCPYFRRHGCPSFVSLKVGHCPFYSVSIPKAFEFLSGRWQALVGHPGDAVASKRTGVDD